MKIRNSFFYTAVKCLLVYYPHGYVARMVTLSAWLRLPPEPSMVLTNVITAQPFSQLSALLSQLSKSARMALTPPARLRLPHGYTTRKVLTDLQIRLSSFRGSPDPHHRR